LPTTPPTVIDPINTVNYVTGAFTLTYLIAPASAEPITSQTVPQITAIPTSLLYFDNTFFLRPVPDKPYKVDIEVYKQPTELLQVNSVPELNQWWQYIAYGAAKKVFEDRSDMESVQQIMPEFKTQEKLVLRRTLVQQTKERVATIYTQQTDLNGNINGWGWGSF
jgi:hypothetical protein